MNTPIIDPSTLTSEQRAEIKLMYIDLSLYDEEELYQGKLNLLEWLFGKELFEKNNNGN